MRRVRGRDPHWITVRHQGSCAHGGCGATIARGERAFYYPSTGSLYGTACGHAEAAALDFAAARQDEEAIGR